MLADRIRVETLKLLVEIAWADHEVADVEAAYLLGLAAQTGVPEADLDFLRRALADEHRLPASDLGLLREHRGDVLRAVDDLIAIDHRIVTDEVAARRAVHRLLDHHTVTPER